MATANTSNIQLAHQHFSSENALNLLTSGFQPFSCGNPI